jgi:uncharacterized protein Veg
MNSDGARICIGLRSSCFLTATVDNRCTYTVPNDEYLRRTLTFHLLVFYVIPMCVPCFFNFKTAHHLKESIRNVPGERQVIVQAGGRRRVANMAVVLTTVLCVTYASSFSEFSTCELVFQSNDSLQHEHHVQTSVP